MPDPAPALTTSRISVEDFRGDFPGISEFIQKAWAGNREQPLLYSAELLASYFNYPGASYSLAPTFYDGKTPLAFIAGIPRRMSYHGRDLKVIISSFLSVAAEHQKKGYGVILWSELVKRARAAGFDGMVNYCVEGEPMSRMLLGCCHMLKLPTARFFTIRHQMRILSPKASSTEPIESGIPADIINIFLEAVGVPGNSAALNRVWTEREVQWQLHRHGAVVSGTVSGNRSGLVAGYIAEIADEQRTKCLLIEDVLWETLEPPERNATLRKFLDHGAAAGAQIAIVPCLHYADMQPFRAARFRPSARVLHAYLTVFEGDPEPQEVSSMYLDVF